MKMQLIKVLFVFVVKGNQYDVHFVEKIASGHFRVEVERFIAPKEVQTWIGDTDFIGIVSVSMAKDQLEKALKFWQVMDEESKD